MKPKSGAGFTLIELLVVVSIIGLLASIVLVSLNSARTKARNAKRNADIEQLAKAFILSYDNTGTWPGVDGQWACISLTCPGGTTAVAAVDAAIAPYIQKPTDPPGTQGYIYNKLFGGFDSVPYGGTELFPGGPYLNWFVEGSSAYEGACGKGGIMSAGNNPLIQCLLKIDLL